MRFAQRKPGRPVMRRAPVSLASRSHIMGQKVRLTPINGKETEWLKATSRSPGAWRW